MTIMDLFLVMKNHQGVRIDNADGVLYIGDAIFIPTDLMERNVTSIKILDEFTIKIVCI